MQILLSLHFAGRHVNDCLHCAPLQYECWRGGNARPIISRAVLSQDLISHLEMALEPDLADPFVDRGPQSEAERGQTICGSESTRDDIGTSTRH